jgi:hypothetical protein
VCLDECRSELGKGSEDEGFATSAEPLLSVAVVCGNRLFQTTDDPLFKTEAHVWSERLLDQRRPYQGIAGWQAWRPIARSPAPEPELGWVTDPRFLTGAADIGLALLDALSSVEPT